MSLNSPLESFTDIDDILRKLFFYIKSKLLHNQEIDCLITIHSSKAIFFKTPIKNINLCH